MDDLVETLMSCFCWMQNFAEGKNGRIEIFKHKVIELVDSAMTNFLPKVNLLYPKLLITSL